MIKLVDINEDNFYQVLKLEVSKEQEPFVSTNAKSLAECWLYRHNEDVFPYAIQDEETVVGFILFDVEPSEGRFMIWRMMIDQRHQNNGYGKAALRLAILKAKEEGVYNHIIADYVHGNGAMQYLLETLNFEKVGENKEDNEVVMRLRIEQSL